MENEPDVHDRIRILVTGTVADVRLSDKPVRMGPILAAVAARLGVGLGRRQHNSAGRTNRHL